MNYPIRWLIWSDLTNGGTAAFAAWCGVVWDHEWPGGITGMLLIALVLSGRHVARGDLDRFGGLLGQP